MRKKKGGKGSLFLYCLCFLMLLLAGCGRKEAGVDYAKTENWAYCENGETEDQADVFFICPTVYGGSEGAENMPMEDQETKESFLGATNMEKGIYDDACRFFAPYYRQAGLYVYGLPEEEREPSRCRTYRRRTIPRDFPFFPRGSTIFTTTSSSTGTWRKT